MAPVEIIDTHVHIWHRHRFDYHWIQPGSALDTDYLLADARADMDARRVTGGILVEASNCTQEIAWLLSQASEDDRAWGVIGWIELHQADAPDLIASLAQNRHWKGIRMNWLESRSDFMSLEPAMRAVAEHDQVVEILMQHEFSQQAADFIRRHPDVRFVIEHCAGLRSDKPIHPQLDTVSREFGALQNVVLKLSAYSVHSPTVSVLREIATSLANAFGHDRLMFGSNWPLCLNIGSYAQTIDLLVDATAPLGHSVERALFAETARSVYRLP